MFGRISSVCLFLIYIRERYSYYFNIIVRLTIFLRILVMNDDGSVIAAAVNAATLAMINAGLKMSFTPIGLCLRMTPDDSDVFLDPTADEANEPGSEFTLVFNNSRQIQKLVAFYGEGKFRHLQNVITVAATAASLILQFMQASTAH